MHLLADVVILKVAILPAASILQVYVDTVGDADRYKHKLQCAFPSLSFTVCPKADALYPVVSAASIVAKVTRDRAILVAQQQLQDTAAAADSDAAAAAAAPNSVNLGTGYPGDPATQAWLSSNMDPVFGFPHLVRFSWDTCGRWVIGMYIVEAAGTEEKSLTLSDTEHMVVGSL
jgi:ribonuclease H2 subunit A